MFEASSSQYRDWYSCLAFPRSSLTLPALRHPPGEKIVWNASCNCLVPNNVLSCESTSDKLKVIWILHSFFQIMLLAIDELSKRYSCVWNRIFPTRWNNLNHLKSFIVMQRLFFIFHWKFSLTESCHKYFNKFLLGKGCFLVRHKSFKRVMP